MAAEAHEQSAAGKSLIMIEQLKAKTALEGMIQDGVEEHTGPKSIGGMFDKRFEKFSSTGHTIDELGGDPAPVREKFRAAVALLDGKANALSKSRFVCSEGVWE